MLKHEIRSPADGLVYLVSCTLATISNLASLKSTPKTELQRQIDIAQAGVDCIRAYKVTVSGPDLKEVVNENWSVAKWAERFKKAPANT